MKKAVFLAPAILWTALVVTLSLLNSSSLPQREWMALIHFDKLVHIVFYAVMTGLYYYGVRKSKLKVNVMLVSCFWPMTVGFVTEMLQWQMHLGRHFEFMDLIANITAVGITWLIIKK